MNDLDALEKHIDHMLDQRKICKDILVVIQNSMQSPMTQHQLFSALVKVCGSVYQLVQNNATEMKVMQERIKMQKKFSGLVFQQGASNLEYSAMSLSNDSFSQQPSQSSQSLFSSSSSSMGLLKMMENSGHKYKVTAERVTRGSSERIVLDPVADDVRFHTFNRNNFCSDSNSERNSTNSSDSVFHGSTTRGGDMSVLNIEDISVTTNHFEAHCSKLSSPAQHPQPNSMTRSTSGPNHQPVSTQESVSKGSNSPCQLSPKSNNFDFQSTMHEDHTNLNNHIAPPPSNGCLSAAGDACCAPHQASCQEIREALDYFMERRLAYHSDWFKFERLGLKLSDQEITHIEENNKGHSYAAKFKKLEKWCKRRKFISRQDVLDQLEKTWDVTFNGK